MAEFFMLILFGILAAVGAIEAFRLWENRLPRLEIPQPWWIWGEGGWRAWVRAFPLLVIASWLGLLTVIVSKLIPEHQADAFGFVRPLWFVGPVFGGIILTFALSVTVGLFNWPSVAVPPHLRRQPGLLREMRDRKRSGRRPSAQEP